MACVVLMTALVFVDPQHTKPLPLPLCLCRAQYGRSGWQEHFNTFLKPGANPFSGRASRHYLPPPPRKIRVSNHVQTDFSTTPTTGHELILLP